MIHNRNSSMKSLTTIKLASINLLVLLGLILSLLFVMSLAGDTFNFAKTFFPKNDKRAEFPSYLDHDKARRIYRDQKLSNSLYVPFAEWRQPQYASENLNIDENGYRITPLVRATNQTLKLLDFLAAQRYGERALTTTEPSPDNLTRSQISSRSPTMASVATPHSRISST